MASSKECHLQQSKEASNIAKELFAKYRCDGKYILDGTRLMLSVKTMFTKTEDLKKNLSLIRILILSVIGLAVLMLIQLQPIENLVSDMADSVTGGGLHRSESI